MPEPRAFADPAALDLRALGWGAGLIALGIGLALGAARVAYLAWRPHDGPPAVRAAPPLLDSAPRQTRTAFLAEKERENGKLEWVDRRAGIARIPVADAMRLLAARSGGKP